jgi:hypothetical protein
VRVLGLMKLDTDQYSLGSGSMQPAYNDIWMGVWLIEDGGLAEDPGLIKRAKDSQLERGESLEQRRKIWAKYTCMILYL